MDAALRQHPCACDLLPHLESLPHFLTVLGSGKPMPSRAEVFGNETIRGEELLRMPRGFKPLHPPLSLARGLVAILRAVVQVPVLAVVW